MNTTHRSFRRMGPRHGPRTMRFRQRALNFEYISPTAVLLRLPGRVLEQEMDSLLSSVKLQVPLYEGQSDMFDINGRSLYFGRMVQDVPKPFDNSIVDNYNISKSIASINESMNRDPNAPLYYRLEGDKFKEVKKLVDFLGISENEKWHSVFILGIIRYIHHLHEHGILLTQPNVSDFVIRDRYTVEANKSLFARSYAKTREEIQIRGRRKISKYVGPERDALATFLKSFGDVTGMTDSITAMETLQYAQPAGFAVHVFMRSVLLNSHGNYEVPDIAIKYFSQDLQVFLDALPAHKSFDPEEYGDIDLNNLLQQQDTTRNLVGQLAPPSSRQTFLHPNDFDYSVYGPRIITDELAAKCRQVCRDIAVNKWEKKEFIELNDIKSNVKEINKVASQLVHQETADIRSSLLFRGDVQEPVVLEKMSAVFGKSEGGSEKLLAELMMNGRMVLQKIANPDAQISAGAAGRVFLGKQGNQLLAIKQIFANITREDFDIIRSQTLENNLSVQAGEFVNEVLVGHICSQLYTQNRSPHFVRVDSAYIIPEISNEAANYVLDVIGRYSMEQGKTTKELRALNLSRLVYESIIDQVDRTFASVKGKLLLNTFKIDPAYVRLKFGQYIRPDHPEILKISELLLGGMFDDSLKFNTHQLSDNFTKSLLIDIQKDLMPTQDTETNNRFSGLASISAYVIGEAIKTLRNRLKLQLIQMGIDSKRTDPRSNFLEVMASRVAGKATNFSVTEGSQIGLFNYLINKKLSQTVVDDLVTNAHSNLSIFSSFLPDNKFMKEKKMKLRREELDSTLKQSNTDALVNLLTLLPGDRISFTPVVVMELIDFTLASADKDIGRLLKKFREKGIKNITYSDIIDNILLQLAFALHQFQAMLGGIHGDFHPGNVFIKYCGNESYGGTPLSEIKHWTYRIGEQTYQVPNIGLLVKIGDMGHSSVIQQPKKTDDILGRDYPFCTKENPCTIVQRNYPTNAGLEVMTVGAAVGKSGTDYLSKGVRALLKFLNINPMVVWGIPILDPTSWITNTAFYREVRSTLNDYFSSAPNLFKRYVGLGNVSTLTAPMIADKARRRQTSLAYDLSEVINGISVTGVLSRSYVLQAYSRVFYKLKGKKFDTRTGILGLIWKAEGAITGGVGTSLVPTDIDHDAVEPLDLIDEIYHQSYMFAPVIKRADSTGSFFSAMEPISEGNDFDLDFLEFNDSMEDGSPFQESPASNSQETNYESSGSSDDADSPLGRRPKRQRRVRR